MTEKQKICNAVDAFSDAMKARLLDKVGVLHGWDTGTMESDDIPGRLLGKISAQYPCREVNSTTLKDMVDIANFAMMLHYRAKFQEERG